MAKEGFFNAKRLKAWGVLLLVSVFIGVAWSIIIATQLIYIPINIIVTFTCGLATVFIFNRINDDEKSNFWNYVYDTGVKTLSIAVSLSAIAITLISLIFSSNVTTQLNIIGVAGASTTKTQIAGELMKSSSNFIGLLEMVIGVYVLGLMRFIKLKKANSDYIKFLSLWIFIIVIFEFLFNLVIILGILRTILYSTFGMV